MRTSEPAFERLEAANPLTDTTRYEPARADAIAFLRGIEEEPMDVLRLTTSPKTPQRPAYRRLIAVAAFVAVLATSATVAFIAGGGESTSGANVSTSMTSGAPLADSAVEEPAPLAELRTSVNAGDAAAAASIHTEEDGCDRFFTTGFETCADWYAFLVGIGTQVTATDCLVELDGGRVACQWTIESDAHRILGINSVEWKSTRVGIDGWSAVQPDGNLFTGTAGFAALDADLWTLVSLELVRQKPALGDVVDSSNRVPATLNAGLAAIVLEVAESSLGS